MALTYILLPTARMERSAAFWHSVVGADPVQDMPTFKLYPLGHGFMLGLWAREEIVPEPAAAGGSEVSIRRDTPAEVDAMHDDWAARGIAILAAPADMGFGRTFVAADPDGHRIRVFAPAA
ncbi:drug:proton antiporter [Acuticoccus sediminis]|uniref:Drug:proton antiporter n=1 Tax=Acuticoccus sediminis TaxID=2184697 RepID=A0A8B2P313_9HYPH|nr:VOC family protein [Acuticoccus sediminis]RAI04536.1 drug:proton antiporter [Acuticoccus sediminis]